jgi:uncharacterized membrane protein YdjX (TVP38/TMEM64 family)
MHEASGDYRKAARVNPRVIVRGLVFLFSLALAAYVLKATHFGAAVDEAWIQAKILRHGAAGGLLFVIAGGVFTAMAFPRQAIGFLGGYAFGFAYGGVLALAATVTGCLLSFYYARFFGRAFVRARFAHRIKRFDDFLHRHPFSMTLLIRLLPVGNNLATNLIAGVSSVRGAPFFAGSALGYIPQTAVFALVGSGVNVDPALRIGLAAALFVISGALGVRLYRKYRHGKTLGVELERELDDASVRKP